MTSVADNIKPNTSYEIENEVEFGHRADNSTASFESSSSDNEHPTINIFIVWTPSCIDSDSNNSHILGIYKNKNLAIKECQKYNDYEEDDIIDRSTTNVICEDASMINHDQEVYCTKIKIDESTNTLYFLKIVEYGDGGSYHRQMWLIVEEDEDMSIDHAIDYFDNVIFLN